MTKQTKPAKPFYSQFIGQKGVKKRLSRYIKGSNCGVPMPPMLFLGARGHGKTEIAEATFPLIMRKDGKSKRSNCVVNCSQFKNADQFFQEAIAPTQGMEITFLFDECHMLPSDVQSALLTAFNPNGQTIKEIAWKGEVYTIDLSEQTFIFATTEPNKMLGTLKERLENITFARYSAEEIGQIILIKKLDVKIKPDVLEEIAKTCRKSPRLAAKLVVEINRYAATESVKTFDQKTWEEYMFELDVKLYGIDNNELEVLKVLADRGSCQLGELASALNMTSSAVKGGIEPYLLNMRFIEIDGTRHITQAGRKALAEILARMEKGVKDFGAVAV